MKSIPVRGGHIAIVDDADYELVCHYPWRLHSEGYAITGPGKRMIYMHRLIILVLPGYVSDHIDGNKLDNRRGNLRACTVAENNRNRSRLRTNKSGYKGVFLSKNGQYRAYVNVNKASVHVGYFATAEAAARAYDTRARDLHGEFARLNFPGPQERAA